MSSCRRNTRSTSVHASCIAASSAAFTSDGSGPAAGNSRSRLHQATEQQRSFVADAAHELRSPIASIRTQLDVALATSTDTAEWVAVAHDVRTDVDRVGRLADDLLFLAKLDSGVPPRPVPLELTALLDVEAPPVWVTADPTALQRAIGNLVSNAQRHSRTTVEVGVEVRDGNAIITVDDDGPGIAPADRGRVFDRWLRLDEGRARDDGGAGLGLSIARSVAHSHGGDVTISASPTGGARAQLWLPADTRESPTSALEE